MIPDTESIYSLSTRSHHINNAAYFCCGNCAPAAHCLYQSKWRALIERGNRCDIQASIKTGRIFSKTGEHCVLCQAESSRCCLKSDSQVAIANDQQTDWRVGSV